MVCFSNVQQLLKDEGINGYEAITDTKAAIVERFNRTFKNKMYRYFTAANTFRYVDVLQDLVKSYNNTYHRSIGMEPINVTKSNSTQARMCLFPSINKRLKRKVLFKVGDYVRISRKKRIFQRLYRTWTTTIYVAPLTKDGVCLDILRYLSQGCLRIP